MSWMVRILGALLAISMIAGCMPAGGVMVSGSGRATTREYDFSGFTKVNVSSAFKAAINRGADYRVSVTIDDNLLDYLDVRVEGDTLHVGMQSRVRWGFGNITQSTEITMPDIEGIELSGATQGNVSGFESDQPLDAEVSGASGLRGDIVAGDTTMRVSGASTVEITGSAPRLDAEVSGASSVRLDNFVVEEARVDASGASNITVNANAVTGSASGASTVSYIGEPNVLRVDTSGASNVRQK